ncbi:MAG TPA: AraC family transcriptional regulator [Gaiellaceae bacterium]|nr:AraC family transcriptional regulator [Gaiellaceae bacterium]
MTESPAHVLFGSDVLDVGEFRCWPDHPRWEELNDIGGRPHVVFPGTSVVIQHLGCSAVLADRNLVMFYNAHDRYRRQLHDRRGDHCVFVAIAPPSFAELVGASGVAFTHAPGDACAYLCQSTVVRRLRAGECDALYVEEAILEAVQRSLERGLRHHQTRTGRRPQTEDRHRELAEAAKAALNEFPALRTSVGELAHRLHVSEFHLARIFRAFTGFTLHAYRNQLRLRLALDLIDEDGCDLATLATELGFSSHSHFTDAFRSLFGAPPSVVRASGRSSRRELRRKTEAPLAARS